MGVISMQITLEKNESVQIVPMEYPHKECPIEAIREMLPLAELLRWSRSESMR